ncbi:serine carboxypeptidase-like 20 [Dorcoceras hygrometricum]|uniref:Serine carboxypeptidase-like 20 n=1 Tax=Dorcoceras hygrometricum TaxID=472368 RepID=A0A2Z7CY85_9LAMI|nr:serine carboxypeptidase-like 20 [Dorcoceras hygrometricum]
MPNKDDKRSTERSKERSTEIRKARFEKRPNRKNDRKVLVAEESNKNWADLDSETTSINSSSESEQEDVHCLMTNQTIDDETFEEIKRENGCLKNSSVELSTAQLEDTDSLQTELSKLKIENDLLRTKSCELSSENERLSQVMSSWTKSSVSLGKLHETQKPLNDKSGLGFSFGERSSEETSTQSDLVDGQFNKMNFVKASEIHDVFDWAVKMRIRPPEIETSICDAKYRVSLPPLTKVGRPSPSTTCTAAAVRSSCDQTCFDHCDEVTPSVEKSISLLVQADWRNRDSGRGPDWRIYRRLQFEVPVSS